MVALSFDRRLLLSALLVPFAGVSHGTPAVGQSQTALPAIVQPTEKTKAGFSHGRAHFAMKP